MNYTLTITNNTKLKQEISLLSALKRDEPNFGLPEGVDIDFTSRSISNKQLLEHLCVMGCRIKFTSSSNNRQLFFFYSNVIGCRYGIEPQKNIDGTPRELKRGKAFKIGDDTFDESDMFVNSFKKQWNPNKWNIADTREISWWDFMYFVIIYLKPKSVFELKFTLFEAKSRFNI